MPPRKNKKNNQNKDNSQIKVEDPDAAGDQPTTDSQVFDAKPEEQKVPETTTETKAQDLSDSVVLVNSSLKEESVKSPKKEEIPAPTKEDIKSQSPEVISEPTKEVKASPQKVENHPVQIPPPEQHATENKPEIKPEAPKPEEQKKEEPKVHEVKHEEPVVQHKPEEVKHEEPKKEEPKIQAPKPETPKKEEPKKEEKPVEVKKEVIVEAPKPTETHAENVEYLAPPQKQASSPEKAQVQASPEKQDKSPEKKNDPIVVSTPPKEVKTNSPLNLDGSIGKNYEIVTKPEEDDASSDIAQAPSESRLLDDLSTPSISQRSSLSDPQSFTISRESSTQSASNLQPQPQPFYEKLASADKFAAEAHDLTKLKQYSAAIERLKSAVDTLNPKDLDKSETEIASKRVFEFTLKISENYFEAKDMDQALNFCQIVHHTDRANLGAALLISKIYIQKNQENEALEALTNTLSKCKKDDQSETYRQVAEEQKRLQNKLKPASQQPKEEPEVKKFNKVQPPAENDNKGEKSEKDWGYISAFGVVGAVVGFATGYALKLSNPKKLLTTAVLAVGSGLIAYYKGDDDDKKK